MQTWTPTQEWKGKDAFLIGGGPSLTGFDFSKLVNRNTIGCNDAFRLGSGVIRYCAFGDAGFLHRNKWEIEASGIQFITCAPSLIGLKFPRLHRMRRLMHGVGQGDTVGWNYSTGALVIDIARLLGANRVFLLGYDLGAKGKVTHWHKYNRRPTSNPIPYDRFLKGFQELAAFLKAKHPEFQVFNVTDGSSLLDCFPKINWQVFDSILNYDETQLELPQREGALVTTALYGSDKTDA